MLSYHLLVHLELVFFVQRLHLRVRLVVFVRGTEQLSERVIRQIIIEVRVGGSHFFSHFADVLRRAVLPPSVLLNWLRARPLVDLNAAVVLKLVSLNHGLAVVPAPHFSRDLFELQLQFLLLPQNALPLKFKLLLLLVVGDGLVGVGSLLHDLRQTA